MAMVSTAIMCQENAEKISWVSHYHHYHHHHHWHSLLLSLSSLLLSLLGHIKSSNFDMKRAFAAMQHDLNTCEFDVRCSGATCVLVCLSGGRLSTSNCGDSRAVLGRRNQNGVIGAHALTNDHKPDKPEERKRILSCGGHLGCRQVLVNQPGRGLSSSLLSLLLSSSSSSSLLQSF